MSLNKELLKELGQRALPGGGYADRAQGQFRVDATAWGILATEASGCDQDILEQHRSQLILEQGGDGRVRMSHQHPESYWPTALAILAWQGSPASHVARDRAVQFLLDTTGVHSARKSDSPSAHDTGLKGWPWIENTHSWVEPTATCMMALRAAGHGGHDRVQEAVRMVLNRQLPHGGWNAGNTIVFGKELHPMPEGTGTALAGLSGSVDEREVARSLEYLQGEVNRFRTPISLGWSLLGLAAWGRWPSNGAALVERCLANQARYGEYDTSSLCVLALGGLVGEGNVRTPLFQHVARSQSSTVAVS
jgi:hypothetical protein